MSLLHLVWPVLVAIGLALLRKRLNKTATVDIMDIGTDLVWSALGIWVILQLYDRP